jgi:DNA-binding transcriptional MerR regulator
MKNPQKALRIGQLAAMTGLSPKTIRYYEQVDLLPSAQRAQNGYRLYNQADVRRLRFIRNARRLGLSINDLREVQTIWDQGRAPCPHVAELVTQRIVAVEQEIRQLHALKQDLQDLLDQAEDQLPAGLEIEAETEIELPDCVCHLISKR